VLAGSLKQGRSRAGCNPQRDVDDRRALAHPHDRRPGSYLQWSEKNERVVGYKDGGAIAASEDCRRAVDKHGSPQAVLIARDNDTRAALNTAAREQLRTPGISATTSPTDRHRRGRRPDHLPPPRPRRRRRQTARAARCSRRARRGCGSKPTLARCDAARGLTVAPEQVVHPGGGVALSG
jgi:hypothetical protein